MPYETVYDSNGNPYDKWITGTAAQPGAAPSGGGGSGSASSWWNNAGDSAIGANKGAGQGIGKFSGGSAAGVTGGIESIYGSSGLKNWISGPGIYTPEGYKYNWSQADQTAMHTGQQQDQWRQRQAVLGEMLMRQAQGQGPSVAQSQMFQGLGQNANAANAQAQSASGGALGRALAQRAAIESQSNANNQAVGQASTLRAQEQLGATGQLGQLYNQARSQDIGYGMDQQGLYQQRQSMQSNTAMEAERQKLAASQAQAEQHAKTRDAIVGGAGGIVGGVLKGFVSSDERVKTDISKASPDEMRALGDALVAHHYKYKSGGPERLGVMAQDLERAPMGKQMVSEGPDGMKRIDESAAVSALLALVGSMSKRMDKLEGGK